MLRSRRDFRLYRERKSVARRIFFVIGFLLIFFFLYELVTSMLITTIGVGSVSMEPTLALGDRIFATPLPFGARFPFARKSFGEIRTPERGQLVLVRPGYYEESIWKRLFGPFVSFFTVQQVRLDPQELRPELLIKRVVAVPGDTVRIEDNVAYIRPEGAQAFLREFDMTRTDYNITFRPLPEGWEKPLPFTGNHDEIVLGEDEYFVMGDNRSMTNDSRYWGPVGIESIEGKLLFRYWPLKRMGAP